MQAMKGQPFELACRGGSLLISESRVIRRGTTAWALWRSQVTGIGCACADAADDATLYLHLHDGRRFAAEEIAPRECFRLFELLGCEAKPVAEADAADRPDDAPLVIDLGDRHTRAIASAKSVTLEQDGIPLWVVPRDQLLGVRVTAGPAAATVQIATRNGGASLLDNVPFAPALRLLIALGAAPAELASLAPPDASVAAPAPAPTVEASSAANPGAGSSTQASKPPPPLSPSGASAPIGPVPLPAPANAPGYGGSEHERQATAVRAPQQPAASKQAHAASYAAAVTAPRAISAPAPSKLRNGKASGRTGLAHARRTMAARAAAIAKPTAPAAPISSPTGSQLATPITRVAPPAPDAPVPTPAAPVASTVLNRAATAQPRQQAPARPPAPIAPAAAVEADRVTPRDKAPEEDSDVSLAPSRRSGLEVGTSRSTDAGTSERPTSGAVTVRQAALLLWHTALAAFALWLAGMRHNIGGALRRVGELLPSRVNSARSAGTAPARVAAGARVAPWSAALATIGAWSTILTRRALAGYHQAGSRVAAIGVAHRSAPGAARDRAPALAARAYTWGFVTRSHTGVRAHPRIAAARWRRIALVAALAVLALPTAGDALVAHLAPASQSGAVVSHQNAAAPEQMEKVRPSRAVVPPAVPAGVLYAGSRDGAIYALDTHTGTLVWRYDIGSPVEGGPAVVDGAIYAGEADGSIVALNAATHRELWRYHTDGSVRGSPIVANGVVYAGSSDDHLYALRSSDGMLLWRFRAGDWFASAPAVSGNMVYAGSYDGTLYALRASDGAEVWHMTTLGAVVVAPTVAGGMVYAGSSDNTIYALDARTGAIRWWYATAGSIYAAPVVTNGVVYAGSCDTHVYALRASDGTLLWHAQAGGLVLAPAVVTEQTVYVGTADGTLDALRASDGTLRWSRPTKAASATAPAVAAGAIYTGSDDSSVFAFDAQDGSVRWTYHTNGRIASIPTVVPTA